MSAPPTIFLENQFGEKSENFIIGGDNTVATVPIADGTVLSNLSGGSALADANTVQDVSNALPAKTGVTAISANATANAATQTGSYVQADVQTIAALANSLKTQVNAILAALKVVS